MYANKYKVQKGFEHGVLAVSLVYYPSYHEDLGLERAVIARNINFILFLFWVKGMRVIQEVGIIHLLGLFIGYD